MAFTTNKMDNTDIIAVFRGPVKFTCIYCKLKYNIFGYYEKFGSYKNEKKTYCNTCYYMHILQLLQKKINENIVGIIEKYIDYSVLYKFCFERNNNIISISGNEWLYFKKYELLSESIQITSSNFIFKKLFNFIY